MSRLSLAARLVAVLLTLATAAACSSPTAPTGKTTFDQTNPNI